MFRLAAPYHVLTTDMVGPTPLIIETPAPVGVEVELLIHLRIYHPTISPAVLLCHPEDAGVPSFSEAPLASLAFGIVGASMVSQVRVRTNRQGQFKIAARSPGTTVIASILGWSCDHPQSNFLTWDDRVLVEGGRIDSMCDLGCGVVVCGGRNLIKGKLFRSTDYGDTWTMQQQLLSSTGIATIKARDGLAYALAEDSRLWRSGDGGQTWAPLCQVSSNTPSGTYTRSYGLEVLPGGTVLVADTCATGHVFRSTDCGVTFVDLGPIGDAPLYRMQAVGDGVLVNGFSGTIFKSKDDGQTWTAIPVASSAIFAIEYAGCGVVYLGTNRGQVFKSTDNGDSWKSIGLMAGEADDMVILDGTPILSTYTASKELYRVTPEGVVSLGGLPVSGWLDHFICIQTPCGPMLVGGTSDGHIVRARKTR